MINIKRVLLGGLLATVLLIGVWPCYAFTPKTVTIEKVKIPWNGSKKVSVYIKGVLTSDAERLDIRLMDSDEFHDDTLVEVKFQFPLRYSDGEIVELKLIFTLGCDGKTVEGRKEDVDIYCKYVDEKWSHCHHASVTPIEVGSSDSIWEIGEGSCAELVLEFGNKGSNHGEAEACCVEKPEKRHEVTVTVGWSGMELEVFKEVLARFEEFTGIDVGVESVDQEDLPAVLVARLAAGNPPDVAPISDLRRMKRWARAGYLVPLDEIGVWGDSLDAFVPLGMVDGRLYGACHSVSISSLVWYNKKAFEAAGYEIPNTWDEMIALSNRIVAEGETPWGIGLECGVASGWPGTHWIEDIMLRTAGPDVYDKWVNHEIPWFNPAVKKAWEYFGQIVLNEDYVFDGRIGALAINYYDSAGGLFTDPPNCYLHRQGTFIQHFILSDYPDLAPLEDYDIFTFPQMNEQFGSPILASVEMIVMFNDRPEVEEFVRYLASAEAQEIWASETGELVANKFVDPDVYTNPIQRKAAEILAEAETIRSHGSDLMPAAVHAAFWTGVLDYVSGNVSLDYVLEQIEAIAVDAYEP